MNQEHGEKRPNKNWMGNPKHFPEMREEIPTLQVHISLHDQWLVKKNDSLHTEYINKFIKSLKWDNLYIKYFFFFFVHSLHLEDG